MTSNCGTSIIMRIQRWLIRPHETLFEQCFAAQVRCMHFETKKDFRRFLRGPRQILLDRVPYSAARSGAQIICLDGVMNRDAVSRTCEFDQSGTKIEDENKVTNRRNPVRTFSIVKTSVVREVSGDRLNEHSPAQLLDRRVNAFLKGGATASGGLGESFCVYYTADKWELCHQLDDDLRRHLPLANVQKLCQTGRGILLIKSCTDDSVVWKVLGGSDADEVKKACRAVASFIS